jgi:hypothetical protein
MCTRNAANVSAAESTSQTVSERGSMLQETVTINVQDLSCRRGETRSVNGASPEVHHRINPAQTAGHTRRAALEAVVGRMQTTTRFANFIFRSHSWHMRTGVSRSLLFSRSCFAPMVQQFLTFLCHQAYSSMATRRISLSVSYRSSPHPLGSCPWVAPDASVADGPIGPLPEVQSERSPRSSRPPTTMRSHDQAVVRSFCSLGKEVSADTQACS